MRYHQYTSLNKVEFPVWIPHSAVDFNNKLLSELKALEKGGFISIYEDPSKVSAYRVDLTDWGFSCLHGWARATSASHTIIPELEVLDVEVEE